MVSHSHAVVLFLELTRKVISIPLPGSNSLAGKWHLVTSVMPTGIVAVPRKLEALKDDRATQTTEVLHRPRGPKMDVFTRRILV